MTAIYILATALGVIVPGLLIFVLYTGIEKSPFNGLKKSKFKTTLVISTLFWSLAVWGLGAGGVFSYHEGDFAPRFVVPLLLPVAIGIYLMTNKDFLTVLDHTPLSLIVGAQTFRLMGVLFILVVNAGLAPKEFVLGGYGDLLTGSLALIGGIALRQGASVARSVTWAFMAAGLADLLNVAVLLLYFYPTWSTALPTSAAAADFPLVLVLGLAAPFALTFHIYTLRHLILAGRLAK